MINIKLVVVGKLKEKFHKDEINEYLKRLSRYSKISIIEVEEEKIKDNASIKENEFVFLLDLHGKEITSEDFAKKLDDLSLNYSTITFVIGGSLGVSDELRKRSNFKLKLSPMTFTHQMTRIIILEQIYRSFKINNNETYHK